MFFQNYGVFDLPIFLVILNEILVNPAKNYFSKIISIKSFQHR